MSVTATSPNRVLLVGIPHELAAVRGLLSREPWSCIAVGSPAEALRQLRNDLLIDIVLLVPGGETEAFRELCRGIKLDERSQLQVVTVLLSAGQDDHIIEFYGAGADDCIRSYAPEREILLRLLKAVRFKRATDSLEDAGAVITSLANAVEGKDHYTCGHGDRVSTYCVALGLRLGVDADNLAALKTGGVVHDIGKIGVPDHILNKPGKLTDEEMAVMCRHPAIGHDILQPLRTFQAILPIVRWHHERPNGTGYPDGLEGPQIPLLARITAVADVFDAISTDRPYRPALLLAQCRAILDTIANRGELDPPLVQVFQEILDSRMSISGMLAPANSAVHNSLEMV